MKCFLNKNKNSKPFEQTSLYNLLTNRKYIGSWEVNLKNKDKKQDKLMPYDRYMLVSLPHGCVIDEKLWNDVQATLKSLAGRRSKNTMLTRIYPLSGILRAENGTPFMGTASTSGNKRRVHYYWNSSDKVRLPVELVENEAKKMVGEIFTKSNKLKEAIRRHGVEAKGTTKLLENEISRLNQEILQLENEKKILNRRLDFLLKDAGEDEASEFREEYRDQMDSIKNKIKEIKKNLKSMVVEKQEVEENSFDFKELEERAEEIQNLIQEHDPVALKNQYIKLFDAIVVGKSDSKGVRPLHFILKDNLKKKRELSSLTEEKFALNFQWLGFVFKYRTFLKEQADEGFISDFNKIAA